MKMFNVKSYAGILPAIAKTEKVMQAVPRLQKIVGDIAKIVLPRSGYSDLSQVDVTINENLEKLAVGTNFKELVKGTQRSR
jgi:hypothetical protein